MFSQNCFSQISNEYSKPETICFGQPRLNSPIPEKLSQPTTNSLRNWWDILRNGKQTDRQRLNHGKNLSKLGLNLTNSCLMRDMYSTKNSPMSEVSHQIYVDSKPPVNLSALKF